MAETEVDTLLNAMGKIVYRRGARTNQNLTPRPKPGLEDKWKTDDTDGPKRGLSVYGSLEQVPEGTSVVEIDLELLDQRLGIEEYDGHLAIVPKNSEGTIDDGELKIWAESRRQESSHIFTHCILNAIIKETKVKKP